jgi:hypothetical protein
MIRYVFKNSAIKIFIYTNIEYSEEEKLKIIEEFHNSPLGGYQGLSKTIKIIKLHHQWKGLKTDVKKYITTCQSCQRNKSSNRPIQHPTPLLLRSLSKIFFLMCSAL